MWHRLTKCLNAHGLDQAGGGQFVPRVKPGCGVVGAGFPTISTFCNFDPIAKRLCLRGVYAQDLAKRWDEAANVVVHDSDADEFEETPESAHELAIRHGFWEPY